MSASSTEPAKHSKLRHEAETRLREGAAPTTAGWSLGANALSLLHELASNPASANDALKLLHELQVHQVELDLQHEQIVTTRRELIEDLTRYEGLYEHAPVAYLNLSTQHDILECNLAAASLFGVVQDELRGRGIEKFVSPASRPALLQLLKRLRADGSRESCAIEVASAKGLKKLHMVASVTPGGRSTLIVLVDLNGRS